MKLWEVVKSIVAIAGLALVAVVTFRFLRDPQVVIKEIKARWDVPAGSPRKPDYSAADMDAEAEKLRRGKP